MKKPTAKIYPFPTFDTIMTEARNRINRLSHKQQQILKQQLEHGQADDYNEPLMDMYLYCYGEIHREKLLMAYHQLPYRLFCEKTMSVIDYACGQSIAELVLIDFLCQKGINRDYITDFNLIDPSKESLKRACNFLKRQTPFSEIIAHNCKLEQVCYDDLHCKSQATIHVFSNIIDLPDVNFERTIDFLNAKASSNSFIVCVSPFYQDDGRGKRMREFGRRLSRYTLEYKLEKHIDDWNRSFSCQIYIFRGV